MAQFGLYGFDISVIDVNSKAPTDYDPVKATGCARFFGQICGDTPTGFYVTVGTKAVAIRSGPEWTMPTESQVYLRPRESVFADEWAQTTATSPTGETWPHVWCYRLADGRGWVHDFDDDCLQNGAPSGGRTMMVVKVTNGREDGPRPRLDINNWGRADRPRGWYDAQGNGLAHDYGRYVVDRDHPEGIGLLRWLTRPAPASVHWSARAAMRSFNTTTYTSTNSHRSLTCTATTLVTPYRLLVARMGKRTSFSTARQAA